MYWFLKKYTNSVKDMGKYSDFVPNIEQNRLELELMCQSTLQFKTVGFSNNTSFVRRPEQSS